MRRKDREITDITEICKILDACKVMRLAMCRDNIPYVVPLNFGYECNGGEFTLCFHCASVGKKLDILCENPTVCFEADCHHDLIIGETACDYGFKFSSIIGIGEAEIVADINEKCRLLSILMSHQTGKQFKFAPIQAQGVTVCKICVHNISGKRCTKLN